MGELTAFAVELNHHKNVVSSEVSNNLLNYLDMNKHSFITEMRALYKGIIPSNFDSHLYVEVYTAYANKFNTLTRKLQFNKLTYKGIVLYKKDTKSNKKGSLKNTIIKKESTKLSKTLTYLTRYGNSDIIDYINKQINQGIKDDKLKFYQDILEHIDKFGFDRLYTLSLQHRNRVLSRYKQVIKFKSLNFKGRSRTKEIVSYNRNFYSKINSFITLSWMVRGKALNIPITFAKDYHGHIKDYHKNTRDYEYSIVFVRDKVKINICIDGERTYPQDKTKHCGIDVNVKHNLFTLSNGISFDYNRELLNDVKTELLKVDKSKSLDSNYIVGKKKQRKIDAIRNKITKSNEALCVKVCNHLNESGLDHVVFENLNNSFGRSFVKQDDINFNRIVKELKLSSLKIMFEGISRKYDISVSLIHPEYTSKQCSTCGCIDDSNRLNQEDFKCVECDFEINADVNAAINIKQRVSEAVLRDKLLKQTKIGNGTFEPKILKREVVKTILLSCR